MELGAFSISLAVKDLKRSMDFYQSLGFETFGGDAENFCILKNGTTVIGLFQGMFEQNILTFNPGWNQEAEALEEFTDVRDIQQTLKEQDVDLLDECDVDSTGPASFMLTDPDGNQILVDQHVGKPA